MDAHGPNDGLHDDVKAETIRIFTSHETANLAAANLQAHGIQCWINADDGGGMLPNLAAPGGACACWFKLRTQPQPAPCSEIRYQAPKRPLKTNLKPAFLLQRWRLRGQCSRSA